MRWRKVTLVGVGLLGGSLGLALRKRALATEVCGYVRRDSSIAECIQAGAVHQATTNLAQAVTGADLIVLCTPLFQMTELALAMSEHVQSGALVTDVGSVKAALVAELEPIFGARRATFIGSHPMAGSEKTGVSAARADLFQNAACAVTPTAASPGPKVEEVEALWHSVGGRVLRLPPQLHDELVSRSSHLPHVIAAQLAAFVLDPQLGAEQGKLCATGFRDTTRIASGSPEMWRDIVQMNRAHLLKALDQFSTNLNQVRTLLAQNDPAAIENFFRQAKTLRDDWTGRCASSSPE